jgi:hypothetical protein
MNNNPSLQYGYAEARVGGFRLQAEDQQTGQLFPFRLKPEAT